jgi:hypothetical protein
MAIGRSTWGLADELLHLPGEPAGVDGDWAFDVGVADELLHLPGEPAGVDSILELIITGSS